MFHTTQDRLRFRYTSGVMAVVLVLICFGIIPHATAQDDVPDTAGTWMTWILESGSQFRVDAPPDETTTTAEIAELMELAGDRDDAALQQIAYWNSGPPSYRWNQIALNVMLQRGVGFPANRYLALLHAAIYDATVATWDSKYTYNRPRPSEVDPALTTAIPNPSNPSYPSEYAVTAAVASTILAWIFPEDAQMFQEYAEQSVQSRLQAGVEYPSDVEAGLALGAELAQLFIDRGSNDGSNAQWTSSVPTEAGLWTGENPVLPAAATWTTWALTAPDQFRPAPPPAYDSEALAAEMQELRDFERTPATSALATFWNFGSGATRNYWHWNSLAGRFILEAQLQNNVPETARVYALLNIAGYDSFVACWDAKYTYWSMRPVQIDPEFTSLFPTPNFPSYPSAHSCLSRAYAGVLAELFPVNSEEVMTLAQQAGESRIWAGIHFRSDVEAGAEIGQHVADAVIAQIDTYQNP